MLKSIEGVYRDGKIELSELPSDVPEHTRVIVTFLDTDVDLRERGMNSNLHTAKTRPALTVQATISRPDSPSYRRHDYQSSVSYQPFKSRPD